MSLPYAEGFALRLGAASSLPLNRSLRYRPERSLSSDPSEGWI
jgi:hypothetical protein